MEAVEEGEGLVENFRTDLRANKKRMSACHCDSIYKKRGQLSSFQDGHSQSKSAPSLGR